MTLIGTISSILLVIGAGLALTGLKTQKWRDVLLTILLLSALAINSFILFRSIFYQSQYVYGPITANASGLFMSEIILFLGFLIFIYSIISLKDGFNNTVYYIIFMLFLFSMIGLTLSFNLLVMYAMLEISTITSAILILNERTRDALRATGIYISIGLIGTLFILAGIFVMYNSLGLLTLTEIPSSEFHFEHRTTLALLLITGFGIKAGLVPAGLIWLPKAYSEAPTPVSALLSGILAQVVAFALIRCIGIIAFKEMLVFQILLGLGLVSAFAGSILALLEVTGLKLGVYQFRGDIKRVLAFSSISEVGILIFIIGIVAGLRTEIIVLLAPAMIHLTNHALAKSNLFLSAGNIIYYTKTRNIASYKGLLKNLPITSFSFILGGLSVSMIPPLFGFTTIREISIIEGHKIFTLLIIVFACMAFTCYMLCFVKTFKEREENTKTTRKENLATLIPIVILDVLLLLLGIGLFLGIIDVHRLGIEEIARTILEI